MTAQQIFSSALKLPARVALYVPSTDNVNQASAEAGERMTNEIARELSALFGGATISPASGAWVSDVFGLVREQINIVYSFAMREQIDANAEKLLKLAEQIKAVMHQEAVSVELDGALYLV